MMCTREIIQDIASEVIREVEFVPGRKIFDLNPDDYFDEYRVMECDWSDTSMPLREFLAEYTNKLIKVLMND